MASELGRWEFLRFRRLAGEYTSQVQLLHELAKIHATFDDPHLVSRAALVPVVALAQRAALAGLAAEHSDTACDTRVLDPCE